MQRLLLPMPMPVPAMSSFLLANGEHGIPSQTSWTKAEVDVKNLGISPSSHMHAA